MRQELPVNQHKERVKKIHQIVEVATVHKNELLGFSYSRGLLGLSLLYYLYGNFSREFYYIEKAKEIFEQSCDLIYSRQSSNFYLDLSELGIFTQFLHHRNILKIDLNDFLGDTDEMLQEQLEVYLKEGYIGGFANGAISIGLYFLHRLPSNPAYFTPIIEGLVKGITRWTNNTSQGCYWKVKPGEDKVYLTMPHGLAAIIVVFAKIAEYGIGCSQNIEEIVTKSISFLLHQEKLDSHYKFNDLLNSYKVSRLAMCYGDMGVGYSLLRSGYAFRNADWYNKGLYILQNCSRRQSTTTTGVIDASILFGTTGLGLMFDKIYSITQDSSFRNSANYWYGQILQNGTTESEYAGFRAAYNQWNAYTNLSFCEGIIGIGAGLIRSLRRESPDFDELIWLL